MNKLVIERIYPDDKRVKPQTIAHHKARYEFAASLGKGKLCLDLACGTGYGTEILRKSGYKAMGIDIDAGAIEYALKHYPKCKFVQLDITDNLYSTLEYDLITIFEAIEHLPYFPAVDMLGRCRRLLSNKGYFVLSTPNDINDKYNTFHRSEWTYSLIKNVLGSYFKTVKIYGQDWDTAEISDENIRNNDFYIAVARNI